MIELAEDEYSPQRAIFSERDLNEFKKSESNQQILEFISVCADSVRGMKISDADTTDFECAPITKFVNFMHELYDLVDLIPPIRQPMRFGNKAFRIWFSRVAELTPIFLLDLFSSLENSKQLSSELSPYIYTSFGNETRIDYGTGHEMTIVVFLFCLFKINLIPKSMLPCVVLKAFPAYMRTMRRLQESYLLEPAGSHGVWGLDDYHCISFVWGAAQLCGNKDDIHPNYIHDKNILTEFSPEYLYLEGIQFIRKIKTSASFAETSPMLNDISSLGEWSKVLMGLLKLFQGEVLHKLPVVQHLLFGTILKCTWETDGGDARLHMNTCTTGARAPAPLLHTTGVLSSGASTANMTALRHANQVGTNKSFHSAAVQKPI